MAKLLQESAASKPDLQTLQALVMMKILSDGSHTKKVDRRRLQATRAESDSEDDSSSEEDKKLRKAARAFHRCRKSKEAMWKKPMKHVRIYIKEVETEHGVEGGEMPYNLWDYARKIPFQNRRACFAATILCPTS